MVMFIDFLEGYLDISGKNNKTKAIVKSIATPPQISHLPAPQPRHRRCRRALGVNEK
jgi:hypothetical protein